MVSRSYGRNQNRPRVQTFVDYSQLGAASVQNEKPLVLLGSALGGVPGQAYSFTSYPQAKAVLRGGELLDAIEMAWNPSPTERGAGRIIAIRVEDAEPSQLEVEGLTVQSRIYGADSNEIQVALEDNTITNSKRFRVVFTPERYERTYDHIGNVFSIEYTGEEEQATVTIQQSSTTQLATRLVISAGSTGDMTEVRSYPLGSGVYEDVHVLISDINNLPDFDAEMFTMGDKNIKSNQLDAIADQDIKAEAHTVTAVAGDLIRQLATDPVVQITVDRNAGLPEEVELQNLTGGSDGTVPASWAEFMPKAAEANGYYIVPLTDQSSIHAEVSQFVRDQFDNNNFPMRAVVGGGLAETTEEILARQSSLRNARVMLTGTSGTYRMGDGRSYNFPAYMFAAQIGGIASGLPIGTPLTFKRLGIEAVDTQWTGDQLDQFDARGVIMAEYVRSRTTSNFRLVSEVTTYNSKTEPVDNKNGLGEIIDFFTLDVRTMLEEEFLGSRLDITSANVMKVRLESFNDEKVKEGLIVDYDPDNISVVINEDTADINLFVIPAQGLNYINVFTTLLPQQTSSDQ